MEELELEIENLEKIESELETFLAAVKIVLREKREEQFSRFGMQTSMDLVRC
jgi:hypothetical protein